MKTALVFSSALKNNQKHLFRKYNFSSELLEKMDVLYLCSTPKDKVLKKDIDLDLEILNNYDLVCPIGAEPLKYVCKMTGITKYNAVFIEQRYIPIIHPDLTIFKPQYEKDVQRAFDLIQKVITGTLTVANNEKYHKMIFEQEAFEQYLNDKLNTATHMVVDIETTSLSPRTGSIIGVAFSTAPHEGVFVSAELVEKYKERLQEIFNRAVCIFHNGKFDMAFLKYHYGFIFPQFEDTMLLHYCLDEALGTHGLKQLALKYTDLGDYERELDDFKKTFARKNKIKLEDFNYGMLPIEILGPYACKDADGSFQLFKKFKPLVEANEEFTKLYTNILIPATKALMQLENNGGPIDTDKIMELYEEYSIDIEECIEEITLDKSILEFERRNEKTFNPNSTAQLREVFFHIQGEAPIKSTDSGAESTDKEVLLILSKNGNKLAEAILDLREKSKIKGTYLENIISGLDKDKRLRSYFNITGTTSGRLSSSGTLNYQNIPRDNKDIKKLFVAKPGYSIVQCDLKTAEVYYAAVLSNDKFLQKAFIEKLDFHSYIAKQIFNLPCEVNEVKKLYPDERQYSKAITFGIMYQAGPATVAEEAHITFDEAKQFIKKYFNEARSLKTWIEASSSFIERNAYIYSFFGRKRRLQESQSTSKGAAKHAVRSGVNFLIQSVASDINVLGLIDCMNWIESSNLQDKIIPFTVVHDSIVSEVKDDYIDLWINKSRELIQTDRGLSIPNCPIGVDYEIGPSWGEVKGIG